MMVAGMRVLCPLSSAEPALSRFALPLGRSASVMRSDLRIQAADYRLDRMLPISTTLVHGLLICIPFSLFVLVTFARWPRLWLHSLPADIQEMAGPKTAVEERRTKLLLIPYLLILPGLSIASALLAARVANINLSVLGAALHIYGIWIVVHLWDLLIIDCGYALLMDPQRPPIPGTAGAKGYRDYAFHVRAFLRAVPMSALFVLPSALLVALLT